MGWFIAPAVALVALWFGGAVVVTGLGCLSYSVDFVAGFEFVSYVWFCLVWFGVC